MRKAPPNRLLTDLLESEIIEMYQSGLSGAAIVDQMGVFKTSKTVYDTLRKYGIPRRDGETMKDPNLDHWYFQEIDTPAKAYALGLMISDGWVSNPVRDSSGNIKKNAQTAFSLNVEDEYLVYWMRDQWCSKNIINHITKKNALVSPNGKIYQSKTMSRIIVTSGRMFQDLNRLGIDANKSYLSILPIIDRSLYCFLFRGIMDGDGSVGIYPYGNEMSLSVSFCGTQCLMGQMSYWLHLNLGLDYVKPSGKKNAVLSKITYSLDNQTRRLTEFLYSDLESAPYLKRKVDRVEDYFNNYTRQRSFFLSNNEGTTA